MKSKNDDDTIFQIVEFFKNKLTDTQSAILVSLMVAIVFFLISLIGSLDVFGKKINQIGDNDYLKAAILGLSMFLYFLFLQLYVIRRKRNENLEIFKSYIISKYIYAIDHSVIKPKKS